MLSLSKVRLLIIYHASGQLALFKRLNQSVFVLNFGLKVLLISSLIKAYVFDFNFDSGCGTVEERVSSDPLVMGLIKSC